MIKHDSICNIWRLNKVLFQTVSSLTADIQSTWDRIPSSISLKIYWKDSHVSPSTIGIITHLNIYRVTQKKVGLVIAVILASKIIYKVTPTLLDIQVPYSKVILSYWWGLCHYWFIFYGYSSLGGPGYFWLNARILTIRLKIAYSCRITKNVFRRLGKVAMSQKLLAIEVIN